MLGHKSILFFFMLYILLRFPLHLIAQYLSYQVFFSVLIEKNVVKSAYEYEFE